MDLTGRPPVRRSTSGVLSIDAHGLRSTGRELDVGAADAGNPDDLLILGHDGPQLPPASWHTHFLEATNHEAPTGGAQRLEFFSGRPCPHQQGVGGEPCSQPCSFLVLGRHRGSPAKAPRPPGCFSTLTFQGQKTGHDAGCLAAEPQPTKSKLADPVAAEWYACTAGSGLEQLHDAAQPSRTKLTSGATSDGENQGVSQGGIIPAERWGSNGDSLRLDR